MSLLVNSRYRTHDWYKVKDRTRRERSPQKYKMVTQLLFEASLCRLTTRFRHWTHLNMRPQCSVSTLKDKPPPERCTYLAQRTQFMCWLSENKNFCLWTVHTLIVLSSEAVTKDWPSLEKWTLLTVAVWALNTVDSPLLYRRKEHFSTQSSTAKMYFQIL